MGSEWGKDWAPWRQRQGRAGAEQRLTSDPFPNSASALPLKGHWPVNSSWMGSVTEGEELDRDASGPSGTRILPRKPGAWKPRLFCPCGWGGPALQEVPEKLRGTCGKLLVGSAAKNNLWKEQDSVYCPSAHHKPSEGALSALPKAPVQGQPEHHPVLHARTRSSLQAASSRHQPTALDTPPSKTLSP